MTTYAIHYFDEPNGAELVDIEYQCSYVCMIDTLTESGVQIGEQAGTVDTNDGGSIGYGSWPGGSETDYDVYCSSCNTLLWKGLNNEDYQ